MFGTVDVDRDKEFLFDGDNRFASISRNNSSKFQNTYVASSCLDPMVANPVAS